jgi:uncharacterized protein YdeI (YjbR/CyaY-like superfamily)
MTKKHPPIDAPKEEKELNVPDDLMTALTKDKKALFVFQNFSCSHKKEYVKWITEAKREETRRQRIEKTITRLTEEKTSS